MTNLINMYHPFLGMGRDFKYTQKNFSFSRDIHKYSGCQLLGVHVKICPIYSFVDKINTCAFLAGSQLMCHLRLPRRVNNYSYTEV